MTTQIPKRFALFGLPGSGKSTFANKLGKALGIPVHHLDRHYFESDWKIRDRNAFLSDQQNMVDGDAWIIEGNSIATLEMRFARADVVVYFHYPRYLCLWRVFKRPFSHDKSINDTPEGCSKTMSWPLLKYLWSFAKEKHHTIEDLRKKYPHVKFYTFYGDGDSINFLKETSIIGKSNEK